MRLILGASLISSGVFTLCIVMLAARNPRKPAWASERWVANCHSIIILMFLSFGLFCMLPDLFKLATDGMTDPLSILASAGILLATIVGVKALKLKKRLAVYEAQAAAIDMTRKVAAVSPGSDPAQEYLPHKAA